MKRVFTSYLAFVSLSSAVIAAPQVQHAAAAKDIDAILAAVPVEARTLAATRDLLLPLLISGEIRLRDAEKMVEAVA